MTRKTKEAKNFRKKPKPIARHQNPKINSLREKPDEYVQCYSNTNHALKSFGFYYWKTNRGRGICKVQVCISCGTFREEFLYPDGTRAYTLRYSHPDDYRLDGKGRLPAQEARKEMLRRVDVIHANRDDLPGLPEGRRAPSRTSRKKSSRRVVAR